MKIWYLMKWNSLHKKWNGQRRHLLHHLLGLAFIQCYLPLKQKSVSRCWPSAKNITFVTLFWNISNNLSKDLWELWYYTIEKSAFNCKNATVINYKNGHYADSSRYTINRHKRTNISSKNEQINNFEVKTAKKSYPIRMYV